MTAAIRCEICGTNANKHPTAHLCTSCSDDLMESGFWLCTAPVHEGDRILPMEKFGLRKHRRYPMMQCLECEHIRDRVRLDQDKQDRRERRILKGWGMVIIEAGLATGPGCHKCNHDHMGACRGEVSIGLPMWCEGIRGHDVIEAWRVDPVRLMETNFLARIKAQAPDILPYLIDHDTIVFHTRSLQNA